MNEFYFIEVNPRIQVEHTITEMVTGIDIVHSQIHIADGKNLHGEVAQIPVQKDIPLFGYAIQSRVTTEDPLNDFMPDTGKLMVYQIRWWIWCSVRCRKWFPRCRYYTVL